MGERGLVIGDLHLFDRDVGYHIDYTKISLYVLEYIDNLIDELKPTYLILTGDLSGALTARRFQTSRFRLQVINHFATYNAKLNGQVYCARGNHDFATKDLSEYEFLLGLGLVKNLNRLVHGKKAIHMVGHGEKVKQLDIVSPGKDIFIGHEDIGVENEEMWYYAGEKQRKLESCVEYMGVGIMLLGHIHNPSPKVISSHLGGYPVDIVYLGAPTRPALTLKDMWTSVYYAVIDESSPDEYDVDLRLWDLPALEETFFVYKKIEDSKEDTDYEVLLTDTSAIKDIKSVLNQLKGYGVGGESIESQIMTFAPGEYPDSVRETALKYFLAAGEK